jgi:hypothetical protein
MPSKTMLAMTPRHRPTSDEVADGWREFRAGIWILDALSVCLEMDGLWHSYANPAESKKYSPGFITISEAMQDARRRATAQLRSA